MFFTTTRLISTNTSRFLHWLLVTASTLVLLFGLFLLPTLKIDICSENAGVSTLRMTRLNQSFWQSTQPLASGCRILVFNLTNYRNPTLEWRLPAGAGDYLIRRIYVQIAWFKQDVRLSSLTAQNEDTFVNAIPDGTLVVNKNETDAPTLTFTLSKPRWIMAAHWGLSFGYSGLVILAVLLWLHLAKIDRSLRLEHSLKILLPILIFLVFVTYGIYASPGIFFYDSGHYWRLRLGFFDTTGHFSLWNYLDTGVGRSYFFPLLLLTVDRLIYPLTVGHSMSNVFVVVLFNATLFLITTWVILPSLFSQMTGERVSTAFRVLLSALVFVFWRNYLFYPLSDFPALFFSLTGWAIAGFLLNPQSVSKLAFTGFLSGVLIMAASLIRPIYMITLTIAILFWLIIPTVNYKRFFDKTIGLLFFILGAGLVIYPQFIIAKLNYGIQTRVGTITYFPQSGLYTYQIATGFTTQRYETNVNRDLYNRASVFFYDRQAQDILQESGQTEITGIGNLFRLFLNYPLPIMLIYLRHLFNGISPFYDTVYIFNIFDLDWLLLSLNYTILFVVIYFFDGRKLFDRNFVFSVLLLAGWLLPVLAAIPGAPEVRFYLPLNLLVLVTFVATILEPSNLKARIDREGWLRISILYLLFVSLCLALAGQIFASLPD